jgi:hypothetical protein
MATYIPTCNGLVEKMPDYISQSSFITNNILPKYAIVTRYGHQAYLTKGQCHPEKYIKIFYEE